MARVAECSVGARFDRYVVVGAVVNRGRKQYVPVRCDCGTEKLVRADALGGSSGSCGCTSDSHGRSHSPEYNSWVSMKQRCLNSAYPRWEDYGGRGITVCDRWRESFNAFFEDMGPKPSARHSIDRIDVNGNYEPGNCRWATPSEQQQNRRLTYDVTCPNGHLWSENLKRNKTNRRVCMQCLRDQARGRRRRKQAALRPLDRALLYSATVRSWGREQGFQVAPKGKIARRVIEAYMDAHPSSTPTTLASPAVSPSGLGPALPTVNLIVPEES